MEIDEDRLSIYESINQKTSHFQTLELTNLFQQWVVVFSVIFPSAQTSKFSIILWSVISSHYFSKF